MAAVRAGVGRETAHEVIKEHAVAVALAMREKGAERNDLLDRLAADDRLGLTATTSTALVAEPLAFTGAAGGSGRGGRGAGRRASWPRIPERRRATRPDGDPLSLDDRERSSAAPELCRECEHVYSGKVRDLYAFADGHLLFVASDRISAYDFVLPTPIPDKGQILTALSLWWFDQLADLVAEPPVVASTCRTRSRAARWSCERLEMFPVECVARGYLAGSGLRRLPGVGGAVCGVALPRGAGRRLAAARADLHAGDQGGRWASTTRTSTSTTVVAHGRRGRCRRSCATLTLDVYARGRGDRRASAASCWPTPSSSSAGVPTARSSSPTRC